jgi:ribosome-binding ATPase YchF (GTP1/OBG family)
VRDLEIIKRELILKDLAFLTVWMAKNRRNAARAKPSTIEYKSFVSVEKCYRFLRYGHMLGGPAVAEDGSIVGGAGGGGGGGGAAAGGGGAAGAAERGKQTLDEIKLTAIKGVEDLPIEESEELGEEVRMGDWRAEDVEYLNPINLLTAKPAVYVCNLSPKQYASRKAKCLLDIQAWLDARGAGERVIPFSVAYEAQLVATESEDERNKLIEEHGKSAVSKIVKEAFRALSLQCFFTAGEDEVRAWVIREGWTAPKAAGSIHSDMENGFICAEIHSYDDLHELGTEAAVKAAGKMRTEGKAYVMKDGDICFFKFSPPAKK